MRSLRKRLLAKAYGCKYKRYQSGRWHIYKLDKTIGVSSSRHLSDEQFIERLKWYRSFDK